MDARQDETAARQDSLRQAALNYHEFPRPGKLEIRATKPLANGRDLARAYSPGVAEACLAIRDDPATASRFTARGNLVAVVSNGSAVLGLGNIGPLAAKPVMEGKAVLFKKFANIDCFDIEVNASDPEQLAAIVCALEPSFGAVNLEDIKAPDCFLVERLCRERMKIPVFHDDQHGTAIVVGAAVINALQVAGKRFDSLRIVSTGGGAAGIACLEMLVKLGVRRENIWLCDLHGLVYNGRPVDMTPEKARFAQPLPQSFAAPSPALRAAGLPDSPEAVAPATVAVAAPAVAGMTLAEVMTWIQAQGGADLFLGLSGPRVLTVDQVAQMASPPILFALANPVPEILPEEVLARFPEALIATGRSDYPNQVNNVLCYPFIFRGALDVGATEINDAMKIACVEGIAALARATSSAEAAAAYQGESLRFGAQYLIPKPFDPRLMGVVAPAVARAAMESGVATRPIEDLEEYKRRLDQSVFRSAMIMRPVFEIARKSTRRIVFADGEDERVLRTAHALREETSIWPILIGRPEVVESRCERAALPIRAGQDFTLVNPENDPRFREYWGTYHHLMQRHGVTPDMAKTVMRANTTVIGAVMVYREEADSLICGGYGQYLWHLNYVRDIFSGGNLRPVAALSLIIQEDGPLFIADTQVHPEPTSEQIVQTVISAARHLRRFGLRPQIALCSHSQFGNLDIDSARRMREAIAWLDDLKAGSATLGSGVLPPGLRGRQWQEDVRRLDFVYEGEMSVDLALDPVQRARIFPQARIEGPANVLVFANIDAADAVRNILKQRGNGLEVGPILMGMRNRVHIVTPTISARGLLNMAALAGTPVDHYF